MEEKNEEMNASQRERSEANNDLRQWAIMDWIWGNSNVVYAFFDGKFKVIILVLSANFITTISINCIFVAYNNIN